LTTGQTAKDAADGGLKVDGEGIIPGRHLAAELQVELISIDGAVARTVYQRRLGRSTKQRAASVFSLSSFSFSFLFQV
jgi:hypothetical protein